MGLLRKDYVSDRFMIPLKPSREDPDTSSYAPGNEERTNPSILSLLADEGMLRRLQDQDGEYVRGWQVRVFESSNPVVSQHSNRSYGDGILYSEPASGYHYVVVASSDPNGSFATIDADQWSNILVVIQDRMRWLYTKKGVTYISVYGGHGKLAGCVPAQPHLNMVTFSRVPPRVEEEIRMYNRIRNERDVCAMCEIMSVETGGPREVLQTGGFMAYCPWSSSYPYEFWISPKKHTTMFTKITQKEIQDLSLIMRSTLGGMSKVLGDIPYNIVFHLSPEKHLSRLLHWHIEVYPLIKQWSGLERGYGIYLNDTLPEDAAKKLGEACRKELAMSVGVED